MPASDGCIRMSNLDVIDLYDQVPVETPVEIQV
jgi:lipoprotein-anchoring transpeptidase ErfK/SrfK